VSVICCDVFGNTQNYVSLTPGVGTISADPLFRGAAGGNFKIAGNSPCINVGTNQTWMTTAVDLEGNPRISDRVVDIGAYELTVWGTILMLR
jgi:hypothetical protein